MLVGQVTRGSRNSPPKLQLSTPAHATHPGCYANLGFRLCLSVVLPLPFSSKALDEKGLSLRLGAGVSRRNVDVLPHHRPGTLSPHTFIFSTENASVRILTDVNIGAVGFSGHSPH